MKRRILALLLAVLTLTALTAAAFAADTPETLGAFNLKDSDGYTLTVVGGESVTGGFYAGATKFKLTCDDLSGKYSLVLLLKEGAKQADGTEGIPTPTERNLQYIDQQNITDTTEFILFPKQMEPGTYNVYVSTDSVKLTKVASLEYGTEPEYIPGDANGDGKVNASDAATILNYCIGKYTFKNNEKAAADVETPYDTVNSADAAKILNYLVGKAELN